MKSSQRQKGQRMDSLSRRDFGAGIFAGMLLLLGAERVTMGMNPGSAGFAMPAGEDEILRRIKDLERTQREYFANTSRYNSVLFKTESAKASNFTIPGDISDVVLTLSIPVPHRYPVALVTVNAMVRGQNFTAQTSYLNSAVRVNGVLGAPGGSGNRAVNGESTTAQLANTFVVEDLGDGDQVDVNLYASVTSSGAPPTTAWAAALSNQASLNVTVTFLKTGS